MVFDKVEPTQVSLTGVRKKRAEKNSDRRDGGKHGLCSGRRRGVLRGAHCIYMI